MLRTILIAALGAMLITPELRAEEACDDLDTALKGVEMQGGRYEVYTGEDSAAIVASIRRAGGTVPTAVRKFLAVWSRDHRDVRIAAFINGCLDRVMDISPFTLSRWLAREGARR